jgi:hypothetical protein
VLLLFVLERCLDNGMSQAMHPAEAARAKAAEAICAIDRSVNWCTNYKLAALLDKSSELQTNPLWHR